MEEKPPYHGDIPLLIEPRPLRYVCCVCGKVTAALDYVRDAECAGFTRIVEEDEIKIWSEPNRKAALIRSKMLSMNEGEILEVRINGAHRIVSEREKGSAESSSKAGSPTSSKKPLDVRDRLKQKPPPPGVEVIWVPDDEVDSGLSFGLPGRGRPANEKPPRPIEDDQSDS